MIIIYFVNKKWMDLMPNQTDWDKLYLAWNFDELKCGSCGKGLKVYSGFCRDFIVCEDCEKNHKEAQKNKKEVKNYATFLP